MKRIYIIAIVIIALIVIIYFANKRYKQLQADKLQQQINEANTQETNGNGLIRYITGLFGKNSTLTEQEQDALLSNSSDLLSGN